MVWQLATRGGKRLVRMARSAGEFSLAALWRPIMAHNRRAGNYHKRIWIVGDGRSGTTWLTDLINYGGTYRQMFEPFHPRVSRRFVHQDPWHYIRADDEDAAMLPFARNVFEGRLRHLYVDRFGPKRLRYEGLLVKDIFGHLMMGWVDGRFPDMKKVLLLRNPCSIAVSKAKQPSWRWMSEPERFLSHPELVADHLASFEDTIRNAADPFERYVVIWCVLHRVAFRQLRRDRVHLVFYEDLCRDPAEIGRLLAYLEGSDTEAPLDPRLLARYGRAAHTSRVDSAVVRGDDLIASWQRAVTEAQVARAAEILAAFGLGGIYDDPWRPRRGTAERLLRGSGDAVTKEKHYLTQL